MTILIFKEKDKIVKSLASNIDINLVVEMIVNVCGMNWRVADFISDPDYDTNTFILVPVKNGITKLDGYFVK